MGGIVSYFNIIWYNFSEVILNMFIQDNLFLAIEGFVT